MGEISMHGPDFRAMVLTLGEASRQISLHASGMTPNQECAGCRPPAQRPCQIMAAMGQAAGEKLLLLWYMEQYPDAVLPQNADCRAVFARALERLNREDEQDEQSKCSGRRPDGHRRRGPR